jgi:hypothetical protein
VKNVPPRAKSHSPRVGYAFRNKSIMNNLIETLRSKKLSFLVSLVGIVALAATILISFCTRDPFIWLFKSEERNIMNIEASIVQNDSFAIPLNQPMGDGLIAGRMDGSWTTEVQSDYRLSRPAFSDSDTLLFVEYIDEPEPLFRLLELHQSDTSLDCQVVFQSENYIGYPIFQDYNGASRLIVTLGDFDQGRSGLATVNQKFFVYKDHQFQSIKGPSFLSISRSAPIENGAFLAIAPTVNTLASEGPSVDDRLIVLNFSEDGLAADDVSASYPAPGTLFAVTSSISLHQIYISSYKLRGGGRDDFRSIFDADSMTTIELPSNRLFGAIFEFIDENGTPSPIIPWVDLNSSNRVEKLNYSIITGNRLGADRAISLLSRKIFDTSTCKQA